MNKRKRVAWEKHRKTAKKVEAKKRAAKAAAPATAAGRATTASS
jgi:hypothetical protein